MLSVSVQTQKPSSGDLFFHIFLNIFIFLVITLLIRKSPYIQSNEHPRNYSVQDFTLTAKIMKTCKFGQEGSL